MVSFFSLVKRQTGALTAVHNAIGGTQSARESFASGISLSALGKALFVHGKASCSVQSALIGQSKKLCLAQNLFCLAHTMVFHRADGSRVDSVPVQDVAD